MNTYHPYTIFPLGDSALTIDFGNVIDEETNKKVIRLFHHIVQLQIPYILDLVPAYGSLTIYYDLEATYQQREEGKTAFDLVAEMVERLKIPANDVTAENSRHLEIPVCYAEVFAPDLHFLARQKGLDINEVVRIHTAGSYRVYMIGFLPGFTYMGKNDPRIAMPRKEMPVPVTAGSVGIAGFQTGIYPQDAPGGWQVIGRTPLRLFDQDAANPVLCQPGDTVKFYSITEDEFKHY